MAYKPPYLLLYVNDLLGSHYVDLMDMEQFGWYMRLLVRSWQWDTPCYLPNDMTTIRSILRIGRREREIAVFEERFKIVYERFSITEDGQSIYHPKLVEQYNELIEKHTRLAEAGLRGGLSGGKGRPKHPDSDPESNSSKKQKPSREASDPRSETVREFIKKCCEFKRVRFIWGASEGKQLKEFLKDAGKDMSAEDVCALVRNRFNSREPPGDRPRIWLSNLGRYATVTNGKQTYADKNQSATVDAVRAVAAKYRGMASGTVGVPSNSSGQTLDAGEVRRLRAGTSDVSEVEVTDSVPTPQN